MAYTISEGEPAEIRAGDVVKWYKTLGDYLPASWTLIYTITDDSKQLQITASDNGDGRHLAEMSIVNTQAIKPASGAFRTMRWIARVNDGSDYHTVGTGTLNVLPDLVAAFSGYDDRSHVKKCLDLIRATLEGNIERSYLADVMADRSVTYKTDEELMVLERKYKRWYEQELQAERIKQGLGGNRTVRVRF